MPKLATSDTEITACYGVISQLRQHLSREHFLDTILKMQTEGYQLAYLKVGSTVVTVAGFRISCNLFMTKNLYVDDLVTLQSHRSKGYGEMMINWLRNEAILSGCKVFHLDSGTQRGEAHKFYFKQGFIISSYHFSENINQ